ncbi:MAG TPA: hypothetical protein PKA55_19625 [Rhodoblastus sp.]|mgnify:CR=1 FL=1|nr:hypothetical protein [Rhodoblastus sp.]
MISCVDREKRILVFRPIVEEDGTKRRERIGAVQKKDFEIGPELDSLSAEERAELLSVIATYREAARLRARAAALCFPQTVTDVIRYYDESASDDERKLIATAFTEGLRNLRRASMEIEEEV